MAGLCKGGNEPPGPLKANLLVIGLWLVRQVSLLFTDLNIWASSYPESGFFGVNFFTFSSLYVLAMLTRGPDDAFVSLR